MKLITFGTTLPSYLIETARKYRSQSQACKRYKVFRVIMKTFYKPKNVSQFYITVAKGLLQQRQLTWLFNLTKCHSGVKSFTWNIVQLPRLPNVHAVLAILLVNLTIVIWLTFTKFNEWNCHSRSIYILEFAFRLSVVETNMNIAAAAFLYDFLDCPACKSIVVS